ncbi:MAG: (2Fe-2S)-binding protein [Planctomycetaceae bacterium]|nr:(2Fe-2S)-binding protein [Planctomycetaceae bacterium]
MLSTAPLSDKIVCHCLRVTNGDIESAAAIEPMETVRDAMKATGAGSGCTACHCAIRKLIIGQRQASSPTCVMR